MKQGDPWYKSDRYHKPLAGIFALLIWSYILFALITGEIKVGSRGHNHTEYSDGVIYWIAIAAGIVGAMYATLISLGFVKPPSKIAQVKEYAHRKRSNDIAATSIGLFGSLFCFYWWISENLNSQGMPSPVVDLLGLVGFVLLGIASWTSLVQPGVFRTTLRVIGTGAAVFAIIIIYLIWPAPKPLY